MHNNRNNRETVIIPQTIIVPTKSVIVASLVREPWLFLAFKPHKHVFIYAHGAH